MKKIISGVLVLLILLSIPVLALADSIDLPFEGIVVSLGANLDAGQEKEMLDLFGVKKEDVKILTVTNQEERDYLLGLIGEDKIGTRAISSAYVELLDKGDGIDVEIHNITWVTREMYANAMVTAGVENAKVIAAAPFRVSGTAALTGIMKAFEEVTGTELSEDAKQIANEELVTTGELGEVIGKDEAAALIKEIKEKITELNITDEGEIKKIIIEISADLNINLTDEQIDRILELMKKIGDLDLSLENITGQIEKITENLDKIKDTIEENKGFFNKILDAIESFFAWIRNLLN